MEADETAPSRKRVRSSPDSEDPQPVERDEELWYGDGTLILIAANVGFRVYGGAAPLRNIPQSSGTCWPSHSLLWTKLPPQHERGLGVTTKQIKTSYSSVAGTAYVIFDQVQSYFIDYLSIPLT